MSIDDWDLDDLLVQSGRASDDIWEALVAEPGSYANWERASRRRTHLDVVAGYLPGRPWLARLVTEAVRKKRASGHIEVPVALAIRGFVADALLATLRPATPSSASAAAPLQWGRCVELELEAGTQLSLGRTADRRISLWYDTGATAPAPLPGAWHVGHGEPPCALIAALDLNSNAGFQAATALSIAIAVPRTRRPTSSIGDR